MDNIEKFEKKIVDLKNAYYNSKPTATDGQYDRLVEVYHDLLRDRDGNIDKSVAREIGAPVRKGVKVKHEIPMGSLDKLSNVEDFQKFINNNPSKSYAVMPKYNGISVNIECFRGTVKKAVTRGDGLEGIDITHKVKHMKVQLPEFIGWCRGEIIVINEDWKNFPSKENYANQLNAVIGVCNGDYADKYVPMYECMTVKLFNAVPKTKEELTVREVVKILPTYLMGDLEIGEEISYELLQQHYEKIKELYPMDGLVIAPMDEVIRVNEKLYPENQAAVKFQGDVKEFTIDRIEWQVSRRGKHTPVALFQDPKELSGVIVKRATAFNYEFVKTKLLGRGSVVTVVRSGEIIPKILEKLNDGDHTDIPTCCVSCGSGLHEESVDLMCPNELCNPRVVGELSNFMKSVGIKNFDASTVKILVEHSYTRPEQLFDITEEFLLGLDNWGEIKAKKFLQEIDKLREGMNVIDVLTGLGFSNVSKDIWSVIYDHIGETGIKELMLSVSGIEEVLKEIPGVGEKRIEGLRKDLISNRRYPKSYRRLSSMLVYPEQVSTEGPLEGRTLEFTGKIEGYSRNDLYELAKSKGAKVKGKFDTLVTDNPNSGTSKVKKAQQQGIDVLSSREFFDLIGEVH